MFLTKEELKKGLTFILDSPHDQGILELIVRRPQINEREIIEEGQLDLAEGLLGDNWKVRGSSQTPDKSAHPEMQLTIMNARIIALIARDKSRWPLAGDQLYIDLDLSEKNLPPGSRLAIGSAIVEVTAIAHMGCKKFAGRFGVDAMKFINSPQGKALHLRGLNTKVIQPGIIRVGDVVRRV